MACQSCRGIGAQLQPLRRAQLATAGLSSLVTGMAVHPRKQTLHSARKLVAMLPVHRGVAVGVAAAAISTEALPTQPALTPRGACIGQSTDPAQSWQQQASIEDDVKWHSI